MRLHQVGSNVKSFSLYLGLGFDPLRTCGQYEGFFSGTAPAGFTCEPLSEKHVEMCSALHSRICGAHRRHDIRAWIGSPHPNCVVLDSSAAVVAYTTGSFLSGHTAAANEEAFVALIAHQSEAIQNAQGKGAPLPPPTLFVPHAYPDLLRRLARNGFRLRRQIVQMGYGPCTEPKDGFYFPAIQY